MRQLFIYGHLALCKRSKGIGTGRVGKDLRSSFHTLLGYRRRYGSDVSLMKNLRPNNSVERDRQPAALVGSLRSFAAPAAPHLKR